MADVSFARLVNQQRRDMNLSLRELARITGIAASTISRIENGRISPALDIAAKLVTALNLEPAVAKSGSTPMHADEKQSLAREEITSFQSEKIVVYRKLGSTILQKGVRRDLSRIAARNGYEMAILLRGTCQLRTNDGFRENLKPGATINCKQIAKHTYFAIAAEEAELLWIA
jgi:transcriptional regulator with XRE-family HTH domain